MYATFNSQRNPHTYLYLSTFDTNLFVKRIKKKSPPPHLINVSHILLRPCCHICHRVCFQYPILSYHLLPEVHTRKPLFPTWSWKWHRISFIIGPHIDYESSTWTYTITTIQKYIFCTTSQSTGGRNGSILKSFSLFAISLLFIFATFSTPLIFPLPIHTYGNLKTNFNSFH